ncbi:MAG: hypothetical protein ACRD1P_04505 [Thermoanaerobaculia bacterium]
MSQSEVTRENFPDLYDLKDVLQAEGIVADVWAFDQYQGPFMSVSGCCRIWYAGDYAPGGSFLIERGSPPVNRFESYGALYVQRATPRELRHGIYDTDRAVRRIAQLCRKPKKGSRFLAEREALEEA